MRTLVRMLVLPILLATLAPAQPAAAFLSDAWIASGDSRFSVETVDEPQWTLVTPTGDVYRGQSLDSAKFRGAFGLSFSDETAITLNGDAVVVKLKGKLDEACAHSFVRLKDRTHDRTITLEFPGERVALSCTAF